MQVIDSVQRLMAAMHVTIMEACQEYLGSYRRHVHVTPKSFLSFLEFYCSLYKSKLGTVRGLAASISTGLRKMDEAKVDVNNMKVCS